MSELPVRIFVGPAFCTSMPFTADIVAAHIDLLLARGSEILPNVGRRQSLSHTHRWIMAGRAAQRFGRGSAAHHCNHGNRPDNRNDGKESRLCSGAQASARGSSPSKDDWHEKQKKQRQYWQPERCQGQPPCLFTCKVPERLEEEEQVPFRGGYVHALVGQRRHGGIHRHPDGKGQYHEPKEYDRHQTARVGGVFRPKRIKRLWVGRSVLGIRYGCRLIMFHWHRLNPWS